jgi:hypothetical protein
VVGIHETLFTGEVIDRVFGQFVQGAVDVFRARTVDVAAQFIEQFDQVAVLPVDFLEAGFEYRRSVEREVGQDAVGAGALEGQQRLQRARLLVQPAVGAAALSIAYSPLTW